MPALAFALLAATPAQVHVDPAAPIKADKIILIGDSTVAVGTGWGAAFCARHVTHAVACLNLARGGRSTLSYRAEGSWGIAQGEMRVAGYAHVWVLIQFGHNDQPGKPGRSTDLATEFPANLRRYVTEARAAGAVPVLVTPLTRRSWKGGKLDRDLDDWAAAVRAVATAMDVPLIDLTTRSAAIVEAMGPGVSTLLANLPPTPEIAAAAAIDGVTLPSATGLASPLLPAEPDRVARVNRSFDYTHLGPEGAALFSAVVASELVRTIPAMRPVLIP